MHPDATVAIVSIERGHIYPIRTFKRISGLGSWAVRSARRDGLRVHILGGKAFVSGDDFADFLESRSSSKAGVKS